MSRIQADAKQKIEGFYLRTSQLEGVLSKMFEDLKQAHHHLEKSQENARASEAMKNQYKLELVVRSTRWP